MSAVAQETGDTSSGILCTILVTHMFKKEKLKATATKMTKGMEIPSCEGNQKKCIFSLAKNKLRKDVIAINTKGEHTGDRTI